MKTFIYKGKEYEYIDRNHNATRDNERGVELALAKEFLSLYDNILEIGAVSPYYFEEYTHPVYDLTDRHSKAIEKDGRTNTSKYNVLSISTIEHFDKGAIEFLENLPKEGNKYLITCPLGINKELDEYAIKHARFMSRIDPTTREDFPKDNWIEKTVLTEIDKKYGTYQWANTLAIFENSL